MKIIQKIISAYQYSIICDLKEIAKKSENYIISQKLSDIRYANQTFLLKLILIFKKKSLFFNQDSITVPQVFHQIDKQKFSIYYYFKTRYVIQVQKILNRYILGCLMIYNGI